MTGAEEAALFSAGVALVKAAPEIAASFRALWTEWQEAHPVLRSLPPPEDEEDALAAEGAAALARMYPPKRPGTEGEGT